MSAPSCAATLRVCSLADLKSKGCIIVRGADHPIAVFYHEGKVRAVDNRCPHMGFPLSQGSVHDGILTCHWHHARFDLASGCTFDLFADDVPTAAVEVKGDEVYISPRCLVVDAQDHLKRRLREGLSQDISLIIAKSVIALMREGADFRDIVREGALFGTRNRDGWASGLTILTAMANLVPQLAPDEQFLALYHGLSRVADDCFNQVPRRDRQPLENSDVDLVTLRRWFRHWVRVRHRDAAERTLLTAIQRGTSQADLTEMLLAAATDRYYADTGHPLDFINKSLEMLDLIGWQHAPQVLPTVIRQLTSARGGEESSAWRSPVDLIAACEIVYKQLPSLFELGRGKRWDDHATLLEFLLMDNPGAALEALMAAIRNGATATQLSKSLCHAAAMRIARFGAANEFGDWITALHTFTHCNALHQSFKRTERAGHPISLDALRGLFHAAMSIYLDRFLNVPPAPLPGERTPVDSAPVSADQLLHDYLETLNTQQSMTKAATIVARYLAQSHPIPPLLTTLARSVLREDADFHTFQMLEASIQQYHEWSPAPEANHFLFALARYASAHAPTQRAQFQTADIAQRLDRSEPLHEE